MPQTTSPVNVSRPRIYEFRDVHCCNFCGASAGQSNVLGLRLNASQGLRPRKKTGGAVSVCRCRDCGLVFANPQPVPAAIDDHYGVPPDAYWKTVNLEPAAGYYGRELDAACELLSFRPGMRAVDVGIGLGKAVRVMRERGFDVYGFEPSTTFHAKALEQLGGDEERFQLASIETAEFDEGTIDFVSFGAVLEHVYDPAASIKKVMEWLRPGGVVYCEVPNSRHLVSKILNAYYRAIGTTLVTNISPMHVPYHLFEFSLESFRRCGDRLNFEVAHHWVEVASIYNIPRFLHPVLRSIMAATDTGMQLTVFLRKKA